jgi:hypothetical protein
MNCPTQSPMIFLIVSLMIFLILSLSKDAANHPARAFAETTSPRWISC